MIFTAKTVEKSAELCYYQYSERRRSAKGPIRAVITVFKSELERIGMDGYY